MMRFLRQLKNLYTRHTDDYFAAEFFTPLDEAVRLIEERRKNPALMAKMREYVTAHTPKHFLGKTPIFYLARHIATPSFEVLRFVEQTKKYGYPKIIGVDPNDKFISTNELKHGLGKLQVTKGKNRNGEDIVENITVVDFSHYDGKPLHSVKTRFGISLDLFHRGLFKQLPIYKQITIEDESDWVEDNGRGDLMSQYHNIMAMVVANGIMFEWYSPDETEFVDTILRPSFSKIEEETGCRPLIVELIPPELETARNWYAYPSELYTGLNHMRASLAAL